MSDINLDFTVNNNSINFTVEPNDITITPTDIQLNITTSAFGPTVVPGGSPTQLQYNNAGVFGGIPNVTYNGSKLSLGNVANVLMTGGTNGYVLQTDGTGNLSWTIQSGGGGNGSPGGANTQIQYNDAGSFGGNVGFTFNEVSGDVSIPNNLSAVTLTGNIITASQPNITSLGNLTSVKVQGMTSIQEAKEKVTIEGLPATGTITFQLLNQAILFYTANASSDYILNFVGNGSTSLNTVLSVGESITCAFINTNGAIGYYANTIQIDGSNITPNWVYPAGAPTTGLPNAKETYNFNIIKTASLTYTVLASRVGYQ